MLVRTWETGPLIKLRAFIVTAALGLTLFATGALAPEAEAAGTPNPYTTSTLTKLYDGTGFVDDKPAPSSSFINGENGFHPGDNGPQDGNVTSGDLVGYHWETKVAAGPARDVEVVLELPEYLSFDKDLNGSFCVNVSGVKGVYNQNPAAPGCTYSVKAGQSFSAGVDIVLTGKDTSGTVQENQVLKTQNKIVGEATYSEDAAQPVTVLSAPSADLLVRPAQCSELGFCSAMSSTTTSSSFIVFPQTIKWQDYDSAKGATASTPWTAQMDVSRMPEGATYSIGGVEYTPNAEGLIDLPETTGELRLDYTVPPNWGGAEFEEGESRDFPVRIIVPKTAFATDDYLNNGDGWEPGQDEGSAYSTYDDRKSGARRGYYYPNNDWTMARVHRPFAPPPGALFDKTITRPWNTNQTLWEEGNTTFTEGGGTTTFKSRGAESQRKVTEGTQIRSEANIYPANNPTEMVSGVTVVLADTWDPTQLLLDGSPVVVDHTGKPLTDHTYKIQWSPSVTNEAAHDPNNNAGWFDTNPASADPTKVKAVRVIIDDVLLGDGGLSKISLWIPQRVADPYPENWPASFPDVMWARAGEESGKFGNNVVPVTAPEVKVGLSGANSPEELDRETGTIDYTYRPTVSGLTSSTDPITGEVTFTVDACITDIDLTGTGWEMVGDFTPGSGCMKDSPQTGSFTVKPAGGSWVPGNDYNAATGTTRLPDIQFTATTNPLVIGDIVVTGEWELTDREGVLPSNPVTTETNAGDYTLTTPELSTSTPKVEITDALKFEASATAKESIGEYSLTAEAILILPGRGDDAAYLEVLKNTTGNNAYVEEGNPTESSFEGDYLISRLEVNTETSVPGAYLECTRESNPSMNPGDYEGSDWSTDCTDDIDNPITAVKLVQPSGHKPAGMNINIELKPKNNKVGDNYLMWLGPIYVDGDAKSMVWPVNDVVVASTISGYTYWDDSGKGRDRQDDSVPLAGIVVELLHGDGSPVLYEHGQPITTTVDEDGYYEFANLHSGKYKTRIPAIGEPNGAPESLESNFHPGETVDVEQTYSYLNQKMGQSSTTSSVIDLGVDTTVPNVNYGFFAADPYSDLLKQPAQIQCAEDAVQCDISWQITIANPEPSGQTPPFPVTLTGGKLTDSTSSEVYDVEMVTAEKIVSAGGWGPAVYRKGSGVVTSGGDYYLVRGSGSSSKVNLPAGESVVSAIGRDPLSSGGSGVITSSGNYYLVRDSGTLTKANLPAGETVVSATGHDPMGGRGSAVVTSSGNYYSVQTTGAANKAQLPEGERVVSSNGWYPRNSEGSSVITESGNYYIVTRSGAVTKAELPAGEKAETAIGVRPAAHEGSGVITSNGNYYIVGPDGTVTKADLPVGETVEAATGISPNRGGWGSGLVTSSGDYYLVRNVGTWIKADLPAGVAAVTPIGNGPLAAFGSGVITKDGEYYIVRNDGSVTRADLPAGETVVSAEGSSPNGTTSASGVVTNGGDYYMVNANGTALRADLPAGEKVVAATGSNPAADGAGLVTGAGDYYIVDKDGSTTKADLDLGQVVYTPVSETLNDGFVTRDYKVPNLEPGEEIIYTFTGKVNRPSEGCGEATGFVIGNQAWESFNETPRIQPELPLPALPAYDKDKPFQFGQWEGNDTGKNSCTATDGWEIPGDQCGQVFAQIDPTDKKLGSLSGYVWVDENKDGIQDTREPSVVQSKVTLYKGANASFSTKVGEALTDDDGYYLFENLEIGDDYYIAFSPAKDPMVNVTDPPEGQDAGIQNLLKPGQSWVYTDQYDQAPWYAVERSAANEDGYTRNVVVDECETTKPVNAGLKVYEAAINVTKGSEVDGSLEGSIKVELDDTNPGYTKPVDVISISTNTGTEPLDSLVFTDTNVLGPKVIWEKCVLDDPTSDHDLTGAEWDEDLFIFTFPAETTLAVGGNMTCAGTIPPVSTDEFPADPEALLHQDKVDVEGVGTITGTPVQDEDPFEVTKTELPEPKIRLEKGVLETVEDAPEGTDCQDPSHAINPDRCDVNSYSESDPLRLDPREEITVTFRITNTGEEPLLDPALSDATTIGEFEVKDISCVWPVKTVNGVERNYLGVVENNVALCSGQLTIDAPWSDHQNQAEVFAIGEVSKKLVTDDSEFNAATPKVPPPAVALPNSGGRTAALFVLLAVITGAVSLTLFNRSQPTGRHAK